MELKRNTSDCAGEERTDERKTKKEFSKFKNLVDKAEDVLKRNAHYVLLGATLCFVSCGSDGKNRGDAEDTVEEVDVSEDGVPDVTDDEATDVPLDEEDAVDIIGDEEELPPPECPSPVENLPPDLNDMFESNWDDSGLTTDGRITADYSLVMSMSPDITATECQSPEAGGYALVCNGDSVNVEGEYYLVAGGETFDTTLEPASSIRDVCSDTSPVYPILAGAPETVMNITYDFGGGVTVDSIAGFTISDLAGFYFDINGSREDVAGLAFTASSAGVNLIQFKRDAAAITFNSRSIDGRGSELTNSHDLPVVEGVSKPFYYIAFDTGDTVNYDVSPAFMYPGNNVCTRCSGGPTYDTVTIALPLVAPVDNACGELGLPSDIRFDATSITISPPHLASTMTVTVSTNVARINGPSDNPSIVFRADYSGPSDTDAISMTVTGYVVVEGVNHTCTGGALVDESHPTTLYVTDTDGSFYSVDCGCTFGG